MTKSTSVSGTVPKNLSISLFFLHLLVALRLRSLRFHSPRLCRVAVFLIQTNVSLRTSILSSSPRGNKHAHATGLRRSPIRLPLPKTCEDRVVLSLWVRLILTGGVAKN